MKKVHDLSSEERKLLSLTSYRALPYAWESKAYQESYQVLRDKLDDMSCLWFLTNVHLALKKGYQGLSVKLTASYWSKNQNKIGIRGIRRVLEYMQTQGYIEVYTGYKDLRKGEVYPSFLVLKPSVIKLFSSITQEEQEHPLERIPAMVLKTRQEALELTFGYSPSLIEKASVVTGYNQSLRSLVLTLDEVSIPSVEYCRSFLDDFDKGGRYYTKGSGFQGMSPKDRLRLKMQGEGVVELDYVSMHPNILYQLQRQEKGGFTTDKESQHFDPYDFCFDAKIDHYSLQKHKEKYFLMNYNPVRNLSKFVLLLMINCSTERQAHLALRSELKKDSQRLDIDRRYLGLSSLDIKGVFDSCLKHNQELKDYFFSDCGLYLQKIDSDIASLVIESFVKEQEPVLCWHDSFVTRESKESMLYSVMKESWLRYFGDDMFCKVSKKTL